MLEYDLQKFQRNIQINIFEIMNSKMRIFFSNENLCYDVHLTVHFLLDFIHENLS